MFERLYCIYDWKAQHVVNGVFITQASNAVAARTFLDIVRSSKSEVSAHSEDYAMLFVGLYDPERLTFQPVNGFQPENVVIDGRDLEAVAARGASA